MTGRYVASLSSQPASTAPAWAEGVADNSVSNRVHQENTLRDRHPG